MRELFVTGLQQYSFYGAEVVGINHIELKKVRAQYLSLVGSPAKSSSTPLALPAAGDLLWRQAFGPILTCSSAV